MARQDPIGFARLVVFLLEQVRSRFSGTITVQFLNGGILTVRREETWIENTKLPVADEGAAESMAQSGRLATLAETT